LKIENWERRQPAASHFQFSIFNFCRAVREAG
jgi:hypothetical protein